jgi:hypothetical protein
MGHPSFGNPGGKHGGTDLVGITQLTGPVTAGPGSGSVVSAITNDAITTAKILDAAVTLAKLANLPVATVIGSITGGVPAALTMAQLNALLKDQQWFELDVGTEIDPVTIANYTLTPPSGFYMIATALRTIQTQLDGTLTSTAIANMGNDAAKVNIAASGAGAFGSLAQINTAPTGLKQYSVALNTLNPAVSNVVSTATPFTLQITTGAVLNTATIYRVRCFLLGALIPI